MKQHSSSCGLMRERTFSGSMLENEDRYCTCGAAHPEIGLRAEIQALTERVAQLEAKLPQTP